jgi:O-antigen ligase
MQILFATVLMLFMVLVLKDTVNMPFQYYLRAALYLMALILGLPAVLNAVLNRGLRNFWTVFALLMWAVIGGIFAQVPEIVLAQVLALSSVVLAGIAMGERSKFDGGVSWERFLTGIIIIYFIALTISLLLVVFDSGKAFEVAYPGAPQRFRGLFAEPGMMANAGSILFGLGLFFVRNRFFKFAVICVGLTCLILPMSRTNWISVIVAINFTLWVKGILTTKRMFVIGILLAVVFGIMMLFRFTIKNDVLKSAVRVESIRTLSGRTLLWDAAFKAFKLNPVIGNGLTAGAAALTSLRHSSKTHYIQNLSKEGYGRGTMHSGYVQALLDFGIVGFVFYVMMLIRGLMSAVKRRADRIWYPVTYLMVFGVVANFGKNIFYATSVGDSVILWITLGFVLSCNNRKEPGHGAPRLHGV